MRDSDCVTFLQWALPRMGFRWPGFRKVRGQVCKRIARRGTALGLQTVAAYRQYLESHPQEWEVLDGFCRITISRFGRDREVFETLVNQILPALFEKRSASDRRAVRVWSAGCGAGEEPYSLVVLARERVAAVRSGAELQIVATDADEHQIHRTRAAVYPASSLRELPAATLESAFSRTGPDAFRLRGAFRRGVEIAVQDLRRVMPAGPFDLVLCRNMAFTYFDPELQKRILQALMDRLAPGGYLVIGSHEELPEERVDLPRVPGCECILGPLGV